jgi:predicted RNA methylase
MAPASQDRGRVTSYGRRGDGLLGMTRLTVAIDGTAYRLEVVPVPDHSEAYCHYALTKPDGTRYGVSLPIGDYPTCCCEDYHYRREHLDPTGCKHIRSLRALGLLGLAWRGIEAAYDPSPPRAVPDILPPPDEPEPPPSGQADTTPDGGKMSRTVNIPPHVADVLRDCLVAENEVRINGTKDRSLYEEVNRVLVALGGRWSGSAKAHVFDRPAAPRLEEALATMVVKPNPLDYFATPLDVAAVMLDRLEMDEPGEDGEAYRDFRILEPSAGDGALVAVLDRVVSVAKIVAVEVDPARAEALIEKAEYMTNEVETWDSDFLGLDARMLGGVFDRVVMNPPFTAEGNPTLYVDHVLHAYTMLDEGGILVAVTPAGWIHATKSAKLTDFRAFVEAFGGHELLPAEAFLLHGTGVRTAVIQLKR